MHARVFFIKAKNANKAIVFRRGPTNWIQMSVWNLDNDYIELGQWINKKVPMRNCDVSPSGKYLIYLVDNSEHSKSRTVISKPPYWTALTAWEHDDPIFDSGGGLFEAENSILLNLSKIVALREYPAPAGLTIVPFYSEKEYNLWKGHINLMHERRLEMNGWTEQDDPEFIQKETAKITSKVVNDYWLELDPKSADEIVPKLWKKKITKKASLYMISFYHVEHQRNFDIFYLGRKEEKTRLEGVEWADIDDNNRIIAVKEGMLFASKISGDGSVDYIDLEMLADLNDLEPKKVLTPAKMKSWDAI